MQKPSPAWGWLRAVAAIKCSPRGEDGKEGGTLPVCGFPARCKCCLVWGRGLGKRKDGKDSPKLLRNWDYIWQHVNQRLCHSTFPLVLLKSLEPLKDPAGCSGTTNCLNRIEPRWLYLKLSLKWFTHFLNVHHVRRNLLSLSNLLFRVILGSEESLLNFYLCCSYHQGYLSLLHKKRKHIKWKNQFYLWQMPVFCLCVICCHSSSNLGEITGTLTM